MIKAAELIKKQQEKEYNKRKTYDKIYLLVEKKICVASDTNNYHTWFQIPEFLVGLPIYSHCECRKYIEEKLIHNGFKTKFYEPNILFIEWKV